MPEAILVVNTDAERLTSAASDFDRGTLTNTIREGDDQRTEIRSRFPKASWPTMPVEHYALGLPGGDETYCRWLEFKSPALGSISGGSSRKLVIFKHKSKPGWFFPSQEFTSHDEAWKSLRGSFVEAFRLADAGEWEAIDLLPTLELGAALCVKSLHVYYPDDILPIYSRDRLRHFLRLFGHHDDQTKSMRRVALNRMLLTSVRAHPALHNWSTIEVGHFLFQFFDPNDIRRVVKIAPGENARYWPDCLEGGYICVGWDEVGDLSDFETKTKFRQRFAEAFGRQYRDNKSKITAKANEVWTLRELQPGDRVVANQGTSKVLAVGVVEEPGYVWDESRAEYRHTVRVKWDTSLAGSIEPQPAWATVTVGKVTPQLFESILGGIGPLGAGTGPTRPLGGLTLEPEIAEMMGSLERKGQLILYGPPGTGKTYTARRLAVAFLARSGGGDAAALIADPVALSVAATRYSSESRTGRTWWVVANPAEWNWDELFANGPQFYREGKIRRNYEMLQKGDLIVCYQSTPVRRVVGLATVNSPLVARGKESRFEVHPLLPLRSGPNFDEITSDPLLARSEPVRMNNQGTLFALTEAEADRLLELISQHEPSASNAVASKSANCAQLTTLTFHPSYAYEDFIEGFRPYDNGSGSLALRLEDGVFKLVCRAAAANPKSRYVILIDEINRANIGKVFGEVVTLLERDKREMQLTLPQSKQRFAVPLNLFVIGTMNTADRSIKLLDSALRRRFAFHELMPDAGLLSGAKVGTLDLEVFLGELNTRISREAGREKQIGHSFLLDGATPVTEPDEFARRFRQEILPLLQEYCYDDFGALATYLGDEIVDRQAGVINGDTVGDPESLISALEKEFAVGIASAM